MPGLDPKLDLMLRKSLTPGGSTGHTCAGMPILSQLVALAAVALVGAVDVGTFLAAAITLTLVHICGNRSYSYDGAPDLRTPVPPKLDLGKPLIPASRANGESQKRVKAFQGR